MADHAADLDFGSGPASRQVAEERPLVVAAWHDRARQLGLSEQHRPDFGAVTRSELMRLTEQHRSLYTHAVPVMEMLHEQILNTHSMVILTDDRGLILHALGDADFLEKAERVALRAGVLWSEASKGTNAIGTALTEARPTLVHGSEHFLRVNRFLTCSCSPIRDPHGRVLGALDVSGSKESYHAHTMALVRMSTQMIENHLFVDRFGQALRIHFHARPEFLGTLVEGIVAFDESGRFVAANPSGQFQLGLSAQALASHGLASLFGIHVPALIDRCRSLGTGILTLCMHNGIKVAARAEWVPHQVLARGTEVPARAREVTKVYGPQGEADTHSRPKSTYGLGDLDTGDAAVAKVLANVRKVQRHEIPILILGETGTGKELLAQAVHNDSVRRDRPFVAVDCASIPESLIEAELFGYEEGAFTGARRKGSHGRIVQANGGTLFLDEMGDMPLGLQTRLLRVLQERIVTPLGSGKAIPVNVSVICATHRNLREMIGRGEFREDLYYRLNGLVVRLPPLREREDLAVLVERILQRECAATGALGVSPEVLAVFRRYRWPGNLRQLTNVLRTAGVMAADDDVIQLQHLPEDLVEELQGDGLLPARGPALLATAPPAVAAPAAARAAPPAPAVTVPPAAMATAAVTAPPVAAHTSSMSSDASLRGLQVTAIRTTLVQTRGNVAAAARKLGISRTTIYRVLAASGPKRPS